MAALVPLQTLLPKPATRKRATDTDEKPSMGALLEPAALAAATLVGARLLNLFTHAL